MSLLITNQVIVDRNASSVMEHATWQVAVDSDTEIEICLALPLNFERKQDAERAKAALERVGLVSEGVLRIAGEEAVIRLMGEALAW